MFEASDGVTLCLGTNETMAESTLGDGLKDSLATVSRTLTSKETWERAEIPLYSLSPGGARIFRTKSSWSNTTALLNLKEQSQRTNAAD